MDVTLYPTFESFPYIQYFASIVALNLNVYIVIIPYNELILLSFFLLFFENLFINNKHLKTLIHIFYIKYKYIYLKDFQLLH